jgi:hypothetical protein
MGTARYFPASDAGNFGGWGPTPLYGPLADTVANSTSEVSCAQTTNVTAFGVRTATFARPSWNSGWRVVCTARVIAGTFTGAGVVVSLLWNGTTIASATTTLSSLGSYTTCGFDLSPAQAAAIGNTGSVPVELDFTKGSSANCAVGVGYLYLEIDDLSRDVSPSGAASAEAFGSPRAERYLSPAGLPSAEAFGSALVQGPREFASGYGSIASAEAFGTSLADARPYDVIADLLDNPDEDWQKLLVARVGAPDDGPEGEVMVVLSTHGYATLGDGAGLPYGVPDHHLFPAGLVSSHSVKLSLLQGGGWARSSLETFGNIVVAWADGELDHLARYSWERRPVEVWAGPQSWIGPSFSKFGRVFQGIAESVDWDVNRLTIRVRDLRQALDKELNEAAYLGFGTAVELRAVGDKVAIAHHAALQPAQLLLEGMVQVDHLHNGVLASKGGDAGYLARLNSDGSLSLFDRGVTNDLHTAAGLVVPNKPTRVSFRGDSAGLKIYVDGKPVASNTTPYGGPTNTSPLVLGARS